ncbi:HU family DNA-binding protein [Nonomuraea sp. NPDC049421]|uniref:HU family DNA-binding protein n=1 Tax=Nonomuraea sp. NPDC049421 TaxID=3155275 RepID=UPI00343CB714
MNKAQFTAAYAQRRGRDPKDAKQDVQAFLDQLVESLADGHRVTFKGYFALRTQKRRATRTHSFGIRQVDVPEQITVKWRTGTNLRAAVQQLLADRQEAA